MGKRAEITLQTMLRSSIIGLSYSFSFMLVFVLILAGRIKPNEELTREDILAAAGIAVTMLSMVATFSYSGLYSIGMIVSNLYGRLNTNRNANALLINEQGSPLPESYNAEAPTTAEALRTEIEHTLHAGLLGSTLVAIPATSVLYFSGDILRACGQSEKIAYLAQDFLRAYSFAIFFLVWRICLEIVALSFKIRLPLMAIALTNFTIGTGLAYLLCFGYSNDDNSLTITNTSDNSGMEIQPSGMVGIGRGYFFETLLTCGSYAVYLAHAKAFKDFHFFKNFRFGQEARRKIMEKITAIVKRGWTIELNFVSEAIALWAVGLFTTFLGPNEQAAFTLCSSFYFFAVIFFLACGQYITQQLAAFITGKQYSDVILQTRYGLLGTNLLFLLPCIAVAVYPELLQWITTNAELNPEILQMLTYLGPLISLIVLLDVNGYGLLASIRSMQEKPADNFRTNILPTMVSFAGTCSGLVAAYGLSETTIYGLMGGYAGGLGLRLASLTYLWMREINRIKAKIPETELPTELSLLLPARELNPPTCSCDCSSLFQRTPN